MTKSRGWSGSMGSLVVMGLLLAGCGSKEESPGTTPTPALGGANGASASGGSAGTSTPKFTIVGAGK